jgi:hypothetical protein
MSKEWNGEGLPATGCQCEVSAIDSSEWAAIEVTAVGRDNVLAVKGSSYEIVFSKNMHKFRPIQTQADKEREDAINDLTFFMKNAPSHEIAAKAIISKGYRLPVEQGEIVSYSNVHHEFMCQHEETVTSYLTNNFIITRKPNV